MKTIKTTLLLCFIALTFGCDSQKSDEVESRLLPGVDKSIIDVAAGKLAPEFKLRNLKGEKVSLKDYRGKLVLINFWATWCVPCVAEMPSLERLYKKYKDKGFEILAISGDVDTEVLVNFVNSEKLTFQILRDPTLMISPKYGLEGFPESFLISKEGKLVSFINPETGLSSDKFVGDKPWDTPIYERIIEKNL